MLITSLNKIINLFLIGSLTLVFMLLVVYQIDKNLIEILTQQIPHSTSTLSLLFVFLALPIILFIGTIMEGLVYAIKPFSKIQSSDLDKNSKLLIFLRLRGIYGYYLSFKMLFFKVLEESQVYYKDFDLDDDNMNEKKKYIAQDIMFKTANANTLDYLDQHYSTYLLAESYFIVLVLAFVFIPFINVGILYQAILMGIILVFVYSLAHFALAKYFWYHYIIYRYGYVFLRESILSKA